MTYREALSLALSEEMRRDERVFVIGDGLSVNDSAHEVTQRLLKITSTLDLHEVLGIVLQAMERVLGFEHAMILLKDLAADRLRARCEPRLRAEWGRG